jgi:hypothetical protein
VTAALVYVYAVLADPWDAELPGMNGQPVRWITAGGLAAAVSDVPTEEFSEDQLNEGVRNMTWLGARAVEHQDVNYRLHDAVEAVIPLAFGTVFRDDERVRQLLRDRAAGLRERLEVVRGCAEWVVALHLVSAPPSEVVAQASTAIQALRAEIQSSSPGKAHLLRRRMAELERDEARRLRDQAVEDTLASLREVAADVYGEPLPAETAERPLLRVSVLVRRTDEAQFVDEVERLRLRWSEPTYRLQITGPWAPYRFGGIDTTGIDDG